MPAPQVPNDPVISRLIGLAQRAPNEMLRAVEAARCERPGGLYRFVQLMWPTVEPSRKFVPGWHIQAICDHLEAVSDGRIRRLLINVPPGTSKSLLTNVFWPAWEWLRDPSLRYLCYSYSNSLTIRDNVRFRQLILSNEYRELWGDRFDRSPDQFSLITVANDKTGWKMASSLGGVATGARADRLVIDDPNNAADIESELVRESTNDFFVTVLPTRLNSPENSAIVCIQQRVHSADVSGTILSQGLPFVHLMIPMEHDGSERRTSIGWIDPRSYDHRTGEPIANVGALMWPAMYPQHTLDELKKTMPAYAYAGQFQQIPVPKGGQIFQIEDWKTWPNEDSAAEWMSPTGKIIYPPMDYIVASVDTAFTQKEENDFCAMVVMGVFRDAGTRMAAPVLRRDESDPVEFLRLVHDDRPKVMLMAAWEKRLGLHGPPEHRPVGVTDDDWNSKEWKEERQQQWGLVEWVADTCKKYRVSHLLIETQAQGHGLEQELRRLHSSDNYSVELIAARGGRGALNKVERAYAVQHLFANGLIYAPFVWKDEEFLKWADRVITTMGLFPRDKHDDLTDAVIHCLQHLRDQGILVRGEEFDADNADTMLWRGNQKALYEV